MQRRTIYVSIAALIGAALAGGAIYVNPMARVAAAYKAKILCSEIFLAHRDPGAVSRAEFAGVSPAVDRVSATIDSAKKEVRASLFGLGGVRADYRDGYGCTVESGGPPEPLPALEPVEPAPWRTAPPVPGEAIDRVDYGRIEYILNEAISDDAAKHRAFVVVVDGRIVAERYAPGFGEETPMLSWSMAKSVTATIAGAAILKGYIGLDESFPAPEWRDPRDPRAAITLNDLLRMQSGLAFTEIYEDPSSDVSEMLFRARDAASVASRQKAAFAPGEHWAYSSGTSNLVARTLREVLAARGIDFYAFAREALFEPLGAASFVIEPDAAGNPIGSSYVYATARDWARLGELYLEGGVWKGERLLPEGWTDYVREPTPASNGEYGAHFWLNRDGEGRKRFVPGLPEEVYYMAGHEGQYVFIIPDRKAVIVRLGQTRGAVPIDVAGAVVSQIYAAIGAPQ